MEAVVLESVLAGLCVWVAVGRARKGSGSGLRTTASSNHCARAAPSLALASALAGLLLLPPHSQHCISQ